MFPYYLCFFMMVGFGLLIYKQLPDVYASVRSKVIALNSEMENENVNENSNPVVAVIFSTSALVFYFLTKDLSLSIFIFVFSCMAYADFTFRWVPDVLLYVMTWISIIGFNNTPFDGVLSIILFCLPAIVIYVFLYLKSGQGCIASGDWYVFPAVGVWISPENAPLMMVACICVAIIASRYIKDVPFITCLFPVFIGGKLCEFYSLL